LSYHAQRGQPIARGAEAAGRGLSDRCERPGRRSEAGEWSATRGGLVLVWERPGPWRLETGRGQPVGIAITERSTSKGWTVAPDWNVAQAPGPEDLRRPPPEPRHEGSDR